MNTHIPEQNVRIDPNSTAGSLKIRGAITGKDMTIMLLLIIYSSGNPFMGRVFPLEPQHICLALFFGFLLFRKQRSFVTGNFVSISLMFALILLVQCVSFSFYPVITIAGFFTRLFIGYAVIRLVENFPYIYVRAMVGLGILGLVIHLSYHVLALGIDIQGLIIKLSTALGVAGGGRLPLFVHTFTTSYPLRNAGMFGEPGMFAGHLVLALIFLAIVKEKLSKRSYKRYLIVLSIALFTTMSTMGYIVYPLAMLLHYEWQPGYIKRNIGRILLGIYIIIPLVLILFTFNYYNIGFLKEKVDKQLRSVEYQKGRWHTTRFGSIAFDWEYIKRRPITGWGLHPKTRYALHPWMIGSEGMGNGMSDFTARFGIAGMLIFGITFFRRIMHVTNHQLFKSLLAILIIFLVLQGETFLNFPLFLGLMFLDRSEPLNKASNFVSVPVGSIGRF